MSRSTTATITMNGSSTGYGAVMGTETFDLTGYDNTVLLAGATDNVNIVSGEFDRIDLNSTGFNHAVTDTINLGNSAFNQVTTSHDLQNATLAIASAGGPNTISLTNHGGSTSLCLGYQGDPAPQGPLLGNQITLNGDATNAVDLIAGGYASVSIGSAGDGFSGYNSSVIMTGAYNTLSGGDAAFSVVNATAIGNSIALGNGSSSVALTGTGNSISFGDGNNTLSLAGGGFNIAGFGGGSNTIATAGGLTKMNFAAGHAGSQDSVGMDKGTACITGGNEDFTINGTGSTTHLIANLGDGNNNIDLACGSTRLVIGTSVANTAHNNVMVENGGLSATFNGGVDTVNLLRTRLPAGGHVVLNGTMLGTQLTTAGVFDTIKLTQDANATINDTGTNAGLNITLNADTTGGFGNIAITGLAQDDLAQIHLIGAGTYTLTTDATPAGGVMLHFVHGTVDLIGLQAVPDHLFGG